MKRRIFMLLLIFTVLCTTVVGAVDYHTCNVLYRLYLTCYYVGLDSGVSCYSASLAVRKGAYSRLPDEVIANSIGEICLYGCQMARVFRLAPFTVEEFYFKVCHLSVYRR